MNSWIEELGDDIRTKIAGKYDALPENDSVRSYARDDVDFGTWLMVVNGACYRRIGFGIFDLPDKSWRDWYEDEMTPGEALRALMEEGIEA